RTRPASVPPEVAYVQRPAKRLPHRRGVGPRSGRRLCPVSPPAVSNLARGERLLDLGGVFRKPLPIFPQSRLLAPTAAHLQFQRQQPGQQGRPLRCWSVLKRFFDPWSLAGSPSGLEGNADLLEAPHRGLF